MTPLLRWSGLILGVTLAVFVVIAVVMQLFNPPKRIEDAVYEHLTSDVAIVDLGADPALRQAYEDSLHAKDTQRVAAEPPPKPRMAVPPREVRGFVQLEVTLDERGRVVDARVVGAVPPGRYEKQALADVRARSYPPIMVDGKAVRGKFAEVVNFQVTAEPAASRK